MPVEAPPRPTSSTGCCVASSQPDQAIEVASYAQRETSVQPRDSVVSPDCGGNRRMWARCWAQFPGGRLAYPVLTTTCSSRCTAGASTTSSSMIRSTPNEEHEASGVTLSNGRSLVACGAGKTSITTSPATLGASYDSSSEGTELRRSRAEGPACLGNLEWILPRPTLRHSESRVAQLRFCPLPRPKSRSPRLLIR